MVIGNGGDRDHFAEKTMLWPSVTLRTFDGYLREIINGFLTKINNDLKLMHFC